MKNTLKIIALASVLLLADQGTKYLSAKSSGESVSLIKDFFVLKYSENIGVAFSIPVPVPMTILLSIVLISIAAYLSYKNLKLEKSLTILVLALFFSGAIGNIIDRVLYGFVIDFISIWKWPVFNVADTYIVIAVLLFVIFYGKIVKVKNKHLSNKK